MIPNLICSDIIKYLDKKKKKIMYVCNMVTQPGETDNMKVSDHIKILNNYLGKHKINVTIANNGIITKEIAEKYSTEEQKDPVLLDEKEIEKLKVELIQNNYVNISENMIRHNVEKLALDIYSYMVR